MIIYCYLETNFSEIWIKMEQFSLEKIHLKMSSAEWWPFHLISILGSQFVNGYVAKITILRYLF